MIERELSVPLIGLRITVFSSRDSAPLYEPSACLTLASAVATPVEASPLVFGRSSRALLGADGALEK